MDMPTEVMFVECVRYLRAYRFMWQDSPSPLRQLESSLHADLSNLGPVASRFFDELWVVHDKRRRDFNVLAINKWLSKQPGYSRCIDLHNKNALLLADYRNRREKRMADAVSHEDAISKATEEFAYAAHDSHWSIAVIQCIAWYMFGEHEVRHRANVILNTQHSEIIQLLRDLKPAFSPWEGRHFEKVIGLVEQNEPGEKPRNSQNKAEHFFVSMMIRVNRRFFRKPKPDVIVELMTMPVFRHRFDLRHVNRLCSDMTKKPPKMPKGVMVDFPPNIEALAMAQEVR